MASRNALRIVLSNRTLRCSRPAATMVKITQPGMNTVGAGNRERHSYPVRCEVLPGINNAVSPQADTRKLGLYVQANCEGCYLTNAPPVGRSESKEPHHLAPTSESQAFHYLYCHFRLLKCRVGIWGIPSRPVRSSTYIAPSRSIPTT
jgi:hypothetical protein